jgi:hypothetical protein
MASEPALGFARVLAAEVLAAERRPLERRSHSRYEPESGLNYRTLKSQAPQGVDQTPDFSTEDTSCSADWGRTGGFACGTIDWPLRLDGIRLVLFEFLD